MIETEVEGDVASVTGASRWLRDSLRSGTSSAADLQADARTEARQGWEGDAAEEYQTFTARVVTATDTHVERIGRAADALDAYATRLGLAQDAMAGLRGRARAGGLSVVGTLIIAPPSVPPSVVVPGSPEDDERQAGIARIQLYDELAGEATRERENLTAWIAAHLPADVEDAQEKAPIDQVLDEMGDAFPNFAAGVGAGFAGGGLLDKANEYRDQAREFRRRSRVSGDPRVRGSADTPSGRAHVDDLLDTGRRLGRFGRLLSGPAGIGIDIAFGIQEGRETGDWTRAALTTGTSVAVGVGVGVAVAAGVIVAPAAVVVIGGGLLAAGAAWGVGQIYDNWDGITDWTGDRVDDVADFASDTWDSATDAVGDTWDAVTPW